MRGLYMAEAAMLVQQARMTLIGNNLVNLQTTGYKRDETVQSSFAELMIYRRPGGAMLPPAAAVGSMAHSVAVRETYTSFTDGPLEFTGRPLDLALTGRSFFQVQTDEGFLYTRNGRFFTDAAGFLVTAEGHRVWGENGALFLGTNQIAVQPDGSVYAGESLLGRVGMFTIPTEAVLVKTGNSYFRLEQGGAIVDGGGQLWPGYLEGSNTALAREMAAMIQVRRSYEAAQKAMITYDSMLQKAANDLGALG